MRFFYFLLLLLFIAVVVMFAYQNNVDTEIKYLDTSKTLPLPALVGAVYLLGMLTGLDGGRHFPADLPPGDRGSAKY